MKKIAAVFTAVALFFGGVVAAAPASATAVAAASDDRLFFKLVTKEAPSLKAAGQKTLVKTAKQTCKFLRSGFTILDAYELMENNDFTEKEITAFLAGAIVFYCPEQENNY